MFDFLGDALGAIVSGGATGLLGSGISLFGEIKKQKMIFEHEEKMEKHRHDGIRLQMEAVKEKAISDINIAEMKAFSKSQENDKATYSGGQILSDGQKWLMVIVDFFRGIIRPGMTIYMTVLTTLIYFEVMTLIEGLGGVIDKDMALGLANQIVLVVLYLTSTTILWWFGTRQKIVQQPKV